MKLNCDKALLLEAVTAAGRAVAVKATNPAMEGMLVTLAGDELRVTGYNGEVGIEAVIEVEGQGDGTVVLGSRLFSEMVRRLPNGQLSLSCDEDSLYTEIKSGFTEFKLNGIPSDDFPALPETDGEQMLKMPQPVLKSMLRQTLYALSQSETKPILTGALFHIEGSLVKVVAVDGYRLAIREEIVDTGITESIKFIVPGKALHEVLRLLGDDEGAYVYMNLSRRQITFKMDGITLISRLIEGEYIDYGSVADRETSIDCRINVREFLDSIERTALLINEKLKMPVRAKFESDRVTVNCKTAQGLVNDEVRCQTVGGELEIGFSDRFMSDALKACETEEIYIRLNTSLSPIVLEPTDSSRFKFLVLPVRLK